MILRVLQETLVNIHRHAEARCIFVILKMRRKSAEAACFRQWQEDERGSRGHTVLGVGIPGMEVRIRQFGGVMTMTSNQRGTIIRVRVPVEGDQEMERETGIA
jgi:two-component system NarL family sensor kinase